MNKVKDKTKTAATGAGGGPGDKKAPAKSLYAQKQQARKGRRGPRSEKAPDEFEQRIVDLARVTRVMAGGKRMRFRACVAIGNRKGKVGVGLDKGADVTIAVNKAVNQAKKQMVDVSIVNETIPHEIRHKFGAARIILKPARQGKGVIAGGAIRIIMELAGIKNITSKNLGTNNKVNVAKCTIEALAALKKIEGKPAQPKPGKDAPAAAAAPAQAEGKNKAGAPAKKAEEIKEKPASKSPDKKSK